MGLGSEIFCEKLEGGDKIKGVKNMAIAALSDKSMINCGAIPAMGQLCAETNA